MKGNKFKAARKISGHNLPLASVNTGVSISTLVNLESGRDPKSPFIIKALEDYIDKWLGAKKAKAALTKKVKK